MTTTTTRPKKPAKPAEPEVAESLTDRELAAVERARLFLLNPLRDSAGVTAAYEDAALRALAVLVHDAATPGVVDDPLLVIASQIPAPEQWSDARNTGTYVGLAEQLRLKLAETELIPVIPGDPVTREELPVLVRQPRRLWPWRRDQEDPWP